MPGFPETACRLLVHPPSDGAWNMAVDEYLLGWTSRSGRCCWRFYRWREPTLSLGYFQEYAERDAHAPSRACRVVRRASGGGAILHDRELTYSFTVPGNHPLARRRLWLYEAVHQMVIGLLSERGVAVRPYAKIRPGGAAPFLCFQRRSAGDLVVGEAKIAGSAQRRLAGAVLQHGSLLLGRSPAAPELPGLEELTGRTWPVGELIHSWQECLTQTLGLRWRKEDLTGEEKSEVARIVAEKYADPHWTWGKRRRGGKISGTGQDYF